MTRNAPLDLAEVTIEELRHRIKNLVSVVQALVMQSLRSATSLEDAAVSIEQRLGAIARSTDILLRSDWKPVPLSELVGFALAHADAFPDRIEVGGPHVEVSPDWTTMLVLALHELETNALKHGALSGPAGRVVVRWTIIEDDGRHLWLQWTESGGPPVTADGPAGFGSRLATTLLQRHLKGAAEIELQPTGLTWRLLAPLGEPHAIPVSGASDQADAIR